MSEIILGAMKAKPTCLCRSQMLLSGVQFCWSKSVSASSSRMKNVSASVIRKYGVCSGKEQEVVRATTLQVTCYVVQRCVCL